MIETVLLSVFLSIVPASGGDELEASLRPAVVRVAMFKPLPGLVSYDEGGGFFVAGSRLVTNRHVAVGATKGEIFLANGESYAITGVVAEDRVWDLALLSTDVPAALAPALPFRGTAIEAGAPLFQFTQEHLVKDPDWYDGEPRAFLRRSGRFTRWEALEPFGRAMATSIVVESGHSGSPLFDEAGELVGVTSFGEGVRSFAVPVDRVAALISSAGDADPKSLETWHRERMNDPEWYVELCGLLADNGRASLALDILGRYLDRAGDAPAGSSLAVTREAWREHGEIAFELAQSQSQSEEEEEEAERWYRVALKSFERALLVPPATVFEVLLERWAQYMRGLTLYRLDEDAAAIEPFRVYIRLEPSDPDGYYHLGVAAVNAGDHDVAREQARVLVELDDAERAAEILERIEDAGVDAEEKS